MSFELKNACFGYDRNGPLILRDLTGTLPDGQRIAVFGRSGLGKTTLMNILALIWEPGLWRRLLQLRWAGWVQDIGITYRSPYGGEAVPYHAGIPWRAWARLRQQEFGLVPQVSHFLSGFTCRQNLALSLALRGRSRETLDRLLAAEQVSPELKQKLRNYPKDVSTGQGQRLSVYRAILHDPAVLFADEPVSNLDDRNKLEMLRLFNRWQRGDLSAVLAEPGSTPRDNGKSKRSLILICHEAETGWAIADSFVFLYPAQVDNQGNTVELHPARGEVVSRQQFCQHYGIDTWYPESDSADPADLTLTEEQRRTAARLGAEAIRRHLEAGVPLPGTVTGAGA